VLFLTNILMTDPPRRAPHHQVPPARRHQARLHHPQAHPHLVHLLVLQARPHRALHLRPQVRRHQALHHHHPLAARAAAQAAAHRECLLQFVFFKSYYIYIYI